MPGAAFLALGSVVLAVTGAEALYADMGHFGRSSIRLAWFALVLPALMINYLGQGALLTTNPEAVANIIASQAVISGAFSVTMQAIQLGFLPRMKIVHTSASAFGQIYIPAVNWTLLVLVMFLVLAFQSSSNLAAAYGIAVTGTMLIDTLLVGVLVLTIWRWPAW